MSIGSVVIQSGGNVAHDFSGASGPMLVGSGMYAVQPRVLSGPFDSLEVTGPAAIEVVRGESCSIEIHGDDNLINFLETELIGSTLHVGIKRGASFSSHLPLKVVAKAPSIEQVDLSGSGDVTLSELDQSELRVELSGSGDVVAQGRVSSVFLTLQGSGDIDTLRIQARRANIKLHGSGDIRAFASEEAKVRLHGSGDVTVAGKPKSRDAKVSGSGDIDFE